MTSCGNKVTYISDGRPTVLYSCERRYIFVVVFSSLLVSMKSVLFLFEAISLSHSQRSISVKGTYDFIGRSMTLCSGRDVFIIMLLLLSLLVRHGLFLFLRAMVSSQYGGLFERR